MSATSASVISFRDGGAPCAKCQDVQVLMEKIVVDMASVTVQTISVSVNQVRKKRSRPT